MVVSCIHPSTTAELYQSNGSFAFASEYQGLAFEQDGRVSQLELTRAIELTRSDYRERLERAEKAQAYEDGFAVLNAWVEFEEWVSRQKAFGCYTARSERSVRPVVCSCTAIAGGQC